MPPEKDADNDQADWAYKAEDDSGQRVSDQESGSGSSQPEESISWTASEFIESERSGVWYLAFSVGILIVSILAFVLTRDYITSAVILIAGIIFIIAAGKKPRQLPYEISGKGIHRGERLYRYDEFKSFDLVQEGGIRSINLMPLKRFMPEVSIYFPPDREDDIIDLLAAHLPHDEQTENTVDKLAKKLRL